MGRPLLIGSRIKNSEAIGGTPAGGFSASWRRILKIFVFDTTLGDGTQGESVSFSVQDKLTVARNLDELGVDYIEGGWPMSNPRDEEFFKEARELSLRHAGRSANRSELV